MTVVHPLASFPHSVLLMKLFGCTEIRIIYLNNVFIVSFLSAYTFWHFVIRTFVCFWFSLISNNLIKMYFPLKDTKQVRTKQEERSIIVIKEHGGRTRVFPPFLLQCLEALD